MKKIVVFYILSLYLAQILFLLMGAFALYGPQGNVPLLFTGGWILFSLLAFTLGIILSAFSLRLINSDKLFDYKGVLIVKLVLIPYFVVNFVICFLLTAGFLNPFLFLGLIVLIPLMIVFTYLALLPATLLSTALSYGYVKRGKAASAAVVPWQILEYFFVLDVISSAVLYVKAKKGRLGTGCIENTLSKSEDRR